VQNPIDTRYAAPMLPAWMSPTSASSSTLGGPVFRNASSVAANNQVVDTPLTDYMATVPGQVVLRPN
jgi:hypothetical protein